MKQGETFLDVGAHVGKYSFQMAKKVKKSLVISVEAHPENYKALRKGIELNGFKNVIPINVAAWNENCKIKLYVSKKAGVHTLKGNSSLEYVSIQAERLDSVLKRLNVTKVDWIKIDVEGAELEALLGLMENLQFHTNLIIETFDSGEVIALLRQFGYVERNLSSGNFLFTHV